VPNAQKTPKHFVDSLLAQLDQKHLTIKGSKFSASLINAYNDLGGKEGLRYEKGSPWFGGQFHTKDGEAEIRNAIGRVKAGEWAPCSGLFIVREFYSTFRHK